MTHLLRSISLASLALGSSAWAADSAPIDLTLAWEAPVSNRVVIQWDVSVAPATGAAVAQTGVARAVWTWTPGTPSSVVADHGLAVRATPRGDADAREATDVLAADRVIVVGSAPVVEAPAPVPVVEDATPDEDAAPVEGAPVVDGPDEAAAPVAPDEAAVPVAPAPTAADLVVPSPHEFGLAFGDLDGLSLVPGSPAESMMAGDDTVLRQVDLLQVCPDVGPGPKCVAVTTTVLSGGAPLEGTDLPIGAVRTVSTWILEPSTMVPHGATLLRSMAYAGPDGAKVLVTRELDVQLMPLDVPAALP